MTRKRPRDGTRNLLRAIERSRSARYVLQLFVSGATPASLRAIASVKKLCEERLPGRYQLSVVDLYQQPELAAGEQVVAAPLLIRRSPLPVRRLIGDMSNTARMLAGLGLDGIETGGTE